MIEQLQVFSQLSVKQWLALHICGFTPRQLAACAPLGIERIFSKRITVETLVAHKVRRNTANKWQVLQLQGNSDYVEKATAWLAARDDCTLVDCCHPDYPRLLLEANSPPLVLYLRGNSKLLNSPTIAMVGSRNPTPQGRENAAWFANALASSGMSVVSGLATGIDGVCHQAALKGGTTLAVMGTGLDSVYPRKHAKLANAIVEKGAIFTEFPLGTNPLGSNFPRRNRIISGISLGVIVVEASINSGSLITARYALDANREVYAIPGHIANPMCKGCHKLIKEGAQLIDNPEDVLKDLSMAAKSIAEPNPLTDLSQLSPDLRAVLEAMGYASCGVDGLCENLNMSVSRINSALIELELEGYVQTTHGGYVRVDGKTDESK